MNQKTSNWIYLVVIALSLILAAAHPLIPERVEQVVPAFDLTHYYLDERNAPGESLVGWDNETHTAWHCQVREGFYDYGCNFSLALSPTENWTQGVDISLFKKLRIEIDHQGPDERFLVYMRNFEPDYATADDYNSAKFEAIRISQADFNQVIELDLEHFQTADWWVNDSSVPREDSYINFNNITSLGFGLNEPSKPGLHRFQIREIALVGEWVSAEHWYLSILVVWMLALVATSVRGLWLLHSREQRYQTRIRELVSVNTYLRSDADKFQLMSSTDALTGLLNRFGFNQLMAKFFPDGRAMEGGSAIILVDIDHFKRINDRKGHQVGDDLLVEFGRLLDVNTRSQDSVTRWGGEEFILFCPYTDERSAYLLAEKIRELIAHKTFCEVDAPLKITASFGVARIREGEEFEALFRRLDKSLYRAKEEGRNCSILASAS